MSKTLGAVWRVIWTRTTPPPEGMPEVLAEKFEPEDSPYCRKKPPEIAAVNFELGSGYSLTWQPVCMPVKQMPADKLANIRRKRLERRIRTKYPLLADQMIETELASKADYYNGITDADIEARREALVKQEHDDLIRWGIIKE